MIRENIGYSLKEFSIIPATTSKIISRSECNPYYEDGMLPIFTAPMYSVLNEYNYNKFIENKINVVLPRTVSIQERLKKLGEEIFVAFSEKEFTDFFVNKNSEIPKKSIYKICIDTANGHRYEIFDKCNIAKAIAKENGYKLILMVGNIANQETYEYICKNCNIDYVRVGIGTGSVCTTSPNTAIHFPLGTLIDECVKIREYIKYRREEWHDYSYNVPKIIADGGIASYYEAIIALALGADYIMLGSMLASTEESSAKIIEVEGIKYKEHFGMSTEIAQEIIDKNKHGFGKYEIKQSEGTHKLLKISGSISDFTNKFVNCIRSTMSYTNCNNIIDFTSGNIELITLSSYSTHKIQTQLEYDRNYNI